MAWMTEEKRKGLAVYYLRLGLGFFALWSAADIMTHQETWNAFLSSYAFIGLLAGLIMVVWFLYLLITGVYLISGWYYREAAAFLGGAVLVIFLLSLFLGPRGDTVLAPLGPMAAKNLIWLGACLMIFAQATDPYNPERRTHAGFPKWVNQAHAAFRCAVGLFLLWDGALKAFDVHGYFQAQALALSQCPFFPEPSATYIMLSLYVIQALAGLLWLTGLRFKWASGFLIALAVLNLLGLNWFAPAELLGAGGRFFMRDVLVLAAGWYFWIAGPGSLSLARAEAAAPPSRVA